MRFVTENKVQNAKLRYVGYHKFCILHVTFFTSGSFGLGFFKLKSDDALDIFFKDMCLFFL